MFKKLCRVEKGGVIDLQHDIPCKIGDTVYVIRNFSGELKVKSGVVSQMYFCEDMSLCIAVYHLCRGRWGDKIFGTREEAEKRLKA